MRRLIIGDIHGQYDKMISALKKAEYTRDDILYSVGDFCDRGNQNYEVIKWMMDHDVKAVIGNHDVWLQNYLWDDTPDDNWIFNGGFTTYQEFENLPEDDRIEIHDWLQSLPYLINEDKFMIFHGGITSNIELEDDLEFYLRKRPPYDMSVFMTGRNPLWDRKYYTSAKDPKSDTSIPPNELLYNKKLFVGHTPCGDEPFISKEYNLINLDTGAAYDGPVTVMDIDTLEYWQSDND